MPKLLHPLFEMDGAIGASSGVDSVPAAEESALPATTQVETASESGANNEVAAEPEKTNNFEKAFAKRLAAEREKWQSETAEKYKDYDAIKDVAEYFRETNGYDNVLSLKERIEMERLQERAESTGVSLELQQRLEYLESRDRQAAEFEQNHQEETRVTHYFNSLNEFVKDKGVESEKLNQFMIDNDLTYDPNDPARSFGIAYKAMRADQLEQDLASAKEIAVKEYLQSKSGPRVEGSGTPGIVQEDTSKMGWGDIRQRTLARIQAANQST